jgi:hypothetical protein
VNAPRVSDALALLQGLVNVSSSFSSPYKDLLASPLSNSTNNKLITPLGLHKANRWARLTLFVTMQPRI